jgi:hypothetical protein
MGACVFFFMLLLLSSKCVHAGSQSFSYQLLAELITVDYLWDANHVKTTYEANGQFIAANNVITGIKVSQTGDIFVSVPRWVTGVPSSLNKLVPNPNGDQTGFVLQPWPSWSFNNVNNGTLKYSQSFTIDSKNCMWIAEVGIMNFYDANAQSTIRYGPPGLIVVNITTGQVLFSYSFPNEIVSHNASFLNDIVLDETNGYVYFSNTWGNGGIIVYDITNNRSHQFTGWSTERNSSYDFCVNDICYGNDGIGASPSDGIALSSDNQYLFWSPVQGQSIYRIPTKLLWDFSISNQQFQQEVTRMGFKTGCSDGLLYMNGGTSNTNDDYLLYGDVTHSALGAISSNQLFATNASTANALTTSNCIVSASAPSDLHWIDTFSADLSNPNVFYFTSNKLDQFFSGNMDFTGQSGPNFQIYRATLGSSSSSNSNSSLSSGTIAGVVIGYIILFVFVVIWRYQMEKNNKYSVNK